MPLSLPAPSRLMTYAILWQVVWITILAVFEVRDWLTSLGVFGANCGSCSEQTITSMILAVWVPLTLGALVFSIGATRSLLSKINPIAPLALVLLIIATLTVAITVFSYYVYGGVNFVLNFG